MNKIEFSDLNKFLTSIGLIFIATAIFLPWYVNQNLVMISIEENEMTNYTTSGEIIITNQQNYLLFISQNLFCIVLVFLILGLVLLTWGIVRWSIRQHVRDLKENAELEAMTPKSISNKEKAALIEEETKTDSSAESNPETIQKYLNIENIIYLRISEHYSVNYINSKNIRIGSYNYDVVMKSRKIEIRGDLILDIKYISNQVNYGQFMYHINDFLSAINHYETTQEPLKRVTPIILFVFDNQKIIEALKFKEKVRFYGKDLRTNLRIKFINENEILSMDAPQYIIEEP